MMYKLSETNKQNTGFADFGFIHTTYYSCLSFYFFLYIDKLQV